MNKTDETQIWTSRNRIEISRSNLKCLKLEFKEISEKHKTWTGIEADEIRSFKWPERNHLEGFVGTNNLRKNFLEISEIQRNPGNDEKKKLNKTSVDRSKKSRTIAKPEIEEHEEQQANMIC